jgi:hypothetical protein
MKKIVKWITTLFRRKQKTMKLFSWAEIDALQYLEEEENEKL